MKNCEYKVVVVTTGISAAFSAKKLEKKANEGLSKLSAELSPEGWELISFSPCTYGEVCIATFRREIQ